MTYKEITVLEKQLLEDLSGFADIYGKISYLILEETHTENRDLNDDEHHWLMENMPF